MVYLFQLKLHADLYFLSYLEVATNCLKVCEVLCSYHYYGIWRISAYDLET